MSVVAIFIPNITASCRIKEKVKAPTVGENVFGGVILSFLYILTRTSPLAAERALCLSGVPSPFFLRLHFTVVPIRTNSLPLSSCWLMGTKVLVSSIKDLISFCIASMNFCRSGALRASLVSISSSKSSSTMCWASSLN